MILTMGMETKHLEEVVYRLNSHRRLKSLRRLKSHRPKSQLLAILAMGMEI